MQTLLAAIRETYKKCGKPEEVILFRIGTFVLEWTQAALSVAESCFSVV